MTLPSVASGSISVTFPNGLALAQTPSANVDVKDAWVRSTVPGQKGTGAYMKITAKDGTQLVGVSTPCPVSQKYTK